MHKIWCNAYEAPGGECSGAASPEELGIRCNCTRVGGVSGMIRVDDALVPDPRPQARKIAQAGKDLLEAIDRYHDMTGDTDLDIRSAADRLREALK